MLHVSDEKPAVADMEMYVKGPERDEALPSLS